MFNDTFIFSYRICWKGFGISDRLKKKQFEKYFGNSNNEITNMEEANDYLKEIIEVSRKNILNFIGNVPLEKRSFILFSLYNKVYNQYIIERKMREKAKEINVRDENFVDGLIINRNIEFHILNSIELWIENSILINKTDYKDYTQRQLKEKNDELLIDLYINALASYSQAQILLSINLDEEFRYTKLIIEPHTDNPLEAQKENPIIFYNPIIMGNLSNLSNDNELKKFNDNIMGLAFKKTFGVDFFAFLCVIRSITEVELKEFGDVIKLDLDTFKEIIKTSSTISIDVDKFLENFVLKEKNVKLQLKEGEEFISKIGTNRYRLGLCPFVLINDAEVIISRANLDKSLQLWSSYFMNGGCAYTNFTDSFIQAMQKRNDELSQRLVDRICCILKEKYTDIIIKTEVLYSEIFGGRSINYGDYDVVAWSKDENQLFIIEAKYISDSLNVAAINNDFQKIFQNKGHHFKFKRRCQLVIEEAYKIKEYLKISDEINTHFLFVSSKPIEASIQDRNKVVTFIPLEQLNDYLLGKYTIGEEDKIVRPIIKV
jgi:hypothetical protein